MRRKPTFKSAAAIVLAALSLVMSVCDNNPYFVKVMSIEGVPETGTAGIPLTLTAAVRPAFASNSTVAWLVMNAGTTRANLNGNILHTDTDGIVLLQAKVANGVAAGKDYTQDFIILIKEGELISNIAINVTGPLKGETPDPVATANGSVGYTIGAVSWSPNDDSFKGSTHYTATVTVTAKLGSKFTESLKATINGHHAEISGGTDMYTTVTISHTFDQTLAKAVVNIELNTQPVKMTYIQGEDDKLDLSGLSVKLTFDDYTTDIFALKDFGDIISTNPPNGDTLSNKEHNNTPVIVSIGKHHVSTDYLTVKLLLNYGLTLTFEEIREQAPILTIPVISRTGANKTTTVSVANPDQYDSDSITWVIPAYGITETGSSITLDSMKFMVGKHYITLEVKKDGVPYSKTIAFEVVK